MPVAYKRGDLVLIKSHAIKDKPFAPKWLGPHRIEDTAGPTSYWIRRGKSARVKYHFDQLRRYPSEKENRPAAPDDEPQPGSSKD
ncbi:hypothetical protein QE152_g33800 [Popillia japonica]|uniref:Uncharacterized protein n=1 Tax=Popillia japonica TaxID=7064 RepID=A0AAW1IVM3_POPJA